MKKVSIVFMISLLLIASECQSADRADIAATNNQQEVYRVKQPLPFFDFSHEREMVTQIYEARNDAVNTWSVWRSEGTGMIEDWCPSIGFGLPYDTSLTNPLKPYYGNSGSVGVEQAEPNGLFASKNTKATWVICVLPDGSTSPVYVEATVTTYSWPIRVENNTVVHLYEEAPSVVLKIGQ